MAEAMIQLHYDVPADDFTRAGEASSDLKQQLKKLGFPNEAVRRVSISMYEGEINLVIHAGGGEIEVEIYPDCVRMRLCDEGPGIENIELAMTEGFSTASDSVRSMGFGAGMGLPNMKRYTDEFELTSTPGQGTCLRMAVFV